ncbi:OmpP1/FadL family transporter [Oceanicola sp. S124]|uniref:OmpP1/FadL family transporter n=1 Tax=Oceanicola sp. S124 TaxID=1042378 RepID=UPI0002558D2B|nr:outer membrane protein transport protein [Oceanicola sp. S124]
MKLQTGAILALLGAGMAHAGGTERTPQSAMILYQKGNLVELSFGHVMPHLSGQMADSNPSGDIANDFNSPSLSLKMDVSDTLALALILDKPWGSDIEYGPSSAVLDGQRAIADTSAATILGKYQLNKNVSLFGGLRIQQSGGSTILDGAAYASLPAQPYEVTFADQTALGYVLGAAYEIPERAMRLALTYNSEIHYDYPTVETFNGASFGASTDTASVTPQSVNIDFQHALDRRTILTASARWVEHSAFQLTPSVLNRDLVNLNDSTTYRIGIGRAFSQKLSGSLTYAFEPKVDQDASSTSPYDGYKQLSLGLSYKATDQIEIGGGLSYRRYNDANATVGGSTVGRFEDNHLTAVGLKMTYKF